MVDLLERIEVMMKQEVELYKTEDYLAPEFQLKLSNSPYEDGLVSASGFSSSASSSSSSGINEVWREKICEWSYQVIDHFEFSREVVSVSIHYLDRYLATRSVNKKMFQLAAMTTLFIAIKLYEPGRLSMSSMIELSRGYFMVEQMAAMEMSILRSLQWRVHPPTTYCFAKHFLFMLPYSSISSEVRHNILELARFLTELSIMDYFFVVHKPSHVAVAALLTSMDNVPGVSEEARDDFVNELKKSLNIDVSCSEVNECCKRLRLLHAQGGYSPAEPTHTIGVDDRISPVCVTGFESESVSLEEEAKDSENDTSADNLWSRSSSKDVH